MDLPAPPAAVPRPKGGTDLSKTLDYDKLIKLLTSKHTAQLFERQVAALNRVARHNPAGFRLRDLTAVTRLIQLGAARLPQQAEFAAPVAALVQLMGEPFVRVKSNEHLQLAEAVRGAFEVLTELLASPVAQVRLATVHALSVMLRREQEGTGGPVDAVAQQELRSAGVIDGCVAALHEEVRLMVVSANAGGGSAGRAAAYAARLEGDSSSDEEGDPLAAADDDDEMQLDEHAADPTPSVFLLALTHVLLQMSYSVESAKVLARQGALQELVLLIDTVTDFQRPIVRAAVETVWNVLEHTAAAMAAPGDCASRRELLDKTRFANGVYLLGTADTMGVLRRLVLRILRSGFRQTDKELRNEVLIISQLLTTRARNLPLFRESGFLDLMLQYATAGEFGHPPDAQPLNYSTAQEPDYELKLLLWMTISGLALRDEENLRIVAESRLMAALLLYIDLPPNELPGPKWTESQLTALRLQALTVLATLAPMAPETYIALDANAVLLGFMDGLSEPAALRACVRVLASVSSLPECKDQLGEMGVVASMLDLLADEARDRDVRALAASVLGAICADHEENQTRLRRSKGIRILHRFLRFGDADGAGSQDFLVSVTDCVWRGIVGNRRSEARLLDMEGVDSLLDLLEVAPQLMRHQVCGVVADLCRNPKTVPYFRAWKSDSTMRSGTRLLLHLWEEEERRLQVHRGTTGVLQNLEAPLARHDGVADDLAGPDGEEEGGGGDPAATAAGDDGEPAPSAFGRLKRALRAAKTLSVEPDVELRQAVDASDLRPKIFSVLASVGFDNVDPQLSIQEQMALCFIQHYPEFRTGMLWAEVKEQLRHAGVQPIFADALHIEHQLEETFNTASQTKCEQMRLREQKLRKEKDDEAEFFRSILLQKEQELHQQLLLKRSKIPLASRRAKAGERTPTQSTMNDPMGSPPALD